MTTSNKTRTKQPTGIRCPVGHTRIWQKGCTPTRQGPKKRYVCCECGRTFYPPAERKSRKK